MQVYVRLGIRLLYKGAKSQMEGNKGTHTLPFSQSILTCRLAWPPAVRSLLKSMSVKQGVKYDAPESAKDIPAFIDFHNLDTSEIRDPLDSFKNFNEFFYRCVSLTLLPHLILTFSFAHSSASSNPTPGLLRTLTIQTDSFPGQTVD